MNLIPGWRDWLVGSNPTRGQRIIRWVLRFGCFPYWIAISLRNRLYDWGLKRSYPCSVPVVSIGNLSVGGTGKSPTVAWAADWFRRHGHRVAILSRGYGQLDDGRNDEALELEFKLPGVPHLQHRDRVESARRAVAEFGAQVLVLDDGFQHRRLARDLDIVLIDATDSPQAEWLLPAGLRREPLSSLRRAHAVILTRADQVDGPKLDELIRRIRTQHPRLVCATAVHRATSLLAYPDRRLPLEYLAETRVLAFCAVGNPAAFFFTIQRLGAKLVDTQVWPDHHAYSREDFAMLANLARDHGNAKLVCTLKDWVKIKQAQIGEVELWALTIEMEFLTGEQEIENLLEGSLAQKRPPT